MRNQARIRRTSKPSVLEPTEKQMVLMYEVGGAKLYQGCHPNVYGHAAAWRHVDVIVDLDNGYERDEDWPAFPLIHPEDKIYIRWKIEDGGKPDIRKLKRLGTFIARSIQQGDSVLVHCAAGQNRSALVLAVALYYLMGGEREKGIGMGIYNFIKQRQPMSFTNYTFRNFVQTLEQWM